MNLPDRIIKYILRVKKPITLDQLVAKSVATGFSELDVLTALEQVHKDKRVQVRNLARGVTYNPAVTKVKPSMVSHLTWLRENYPPMTPETDGSGIDADYSYMFLKTKEERDAFFAEMKGRPVRYNRNRYGQNT